MTQRKAIKLAIESLKYKRKQYSVGFVTRSYGLLDTWTERDHKKYKELTEAIEILSDMITCNRR